MMFQQPHQQSQRFAPKPPTASPVQPAASTADSTQDDKNFSRQPVTFDGKRMRKAVMRKTVDYNSSVVKQIENRKWFKDLSKRTGMQPDDTFSSDVFPPGCLLDNPINAVTTKFVRTSTNKLRCPIFCVAWTPEGRRLVTGASSGEFTLWNGLTFNFETILQAHESPVRSMVWSHADNWLLSSDHGGYIKYWQSNMNNVKMYEAHKEPIRGLRLATLVPGTQQNGRFLAVLVGIVELIELLIELAVVQQMNNLSPNSGCPKNRSEITKR